MSAVAELINQLCPSGVEYKTLGEVGRFFGGLTGKNKEDFEAGNAKYISYMNVFSNSAVDVNVEDRVRIAVGERQNVLCYGDVLFTGSSETPEECGMTSVLATHTDEPLYLNSFCIGFRLACPGMYEPCFLKHLLRADGIRKQICKTASGVTRFNVSKVRLAKVEIPVPPLPVQQEIVRRLDAMTGLIADLEKELAARQKQYEWVRDETFKRLDAEGVERKKIGEILDYEQPTRYIVRSTEYDDTYETPVLTAGQSFVLGYTDEEDNHCMANASSPVIIFDDFTTASQWVDFEFKVKSSAMKILKSKSKENSFMRFIYYAMKCIRYTPVEHSRHWIGKYSNFEISLPPLPVQQTIVRRLDEMTELIAWIGKEIALRKQQYEYCREKLLTFKRAG